MKTRIAIAGREGTFLTGVMDYVNRQGALEAFVFTDERCLEDELEQMKPEILFREEDFGTKIFFDGREVLLCKNQIGEEESRKNRTGEENCVLDRVDRIYMYRPVDVLYEQILRYSGRTDTVRKTRQSDQGGIYAVYSPLGRSGKTSYALAFSREHSFFYIGMEEYGIAGNKEHTIDEILYHIRNRKKEIAEVLLEYSEVWNGVHMLASPLIFPDLKVLGTEDYSWFFDQLREKDEFRAVMVDLGSGSLTDYEIFDLFDRIYIPVLDGEVGQEKLNLFWNRLREFYGEPDQRYRAVRVPIADWQEENFLSQVEESDFRPAGLRMKEGGCYGSNWDREGQT
ncbi:MAG: hypothetical protein Q4B70_02205 [Lachnospiraceae bacterium]|nr:hypothetical protein [Lachnospiraceae bacterium]